MPAGERCDLLVVGAGPAGLSRAFWHLREFPDAAVRVLEAGPRPGGWARTEVVDGYQLELGPQGFRPDDGVDDLLRAANLQERVIPCCDSALRRFVVRSGRVHELPSRPGALLRSRLLSLFAKLRLLTEPRVRSRSPTGESVAAFVTRRFGRAVAPLAEAMMHGIYAGDAHALEVAATLPAAVELEREHGSLLRGLGAKRRERRNSGGAQADRPAVCTFAGGMQESVDSLTATLGDRIETDAEVHAITRRGDDGTYVVQVRGAADIEARAVCVATPPAAAADMLRPLDSELGDLLAAIPTVSVASVYLGFARTDVPDSVDGFGVLAPQGELGPVLGAIYTSRVFPHQAPPDRVLFRVMSGGFAFPGEVDRTDDELVAQASQTLRQLLPIRGEPVFHRVHRARAAIPQYVRGHGARVQAIAERLRAHERLGLRGAGYRKVSIVGQWTTAGSAP